MKRRGIVIIVLVLFSFIMGLYFYPLMPDRVASHWDAWGNVNGYMSRFWGTFLMPLILTALALLFAAIPRIDPLRENIEKARSYYDGFIILFLIFMLAIYTQMILWNIGIKIAPNIILTVGSGVLFFYSGILCENAKQNWFIGIRTPWTLSSENVWNKTHRIGAKLFKIAGLVVLSGILFQKYAIFIIRVSLLLVVIYTVIYSYIEYQKEIKG